MTSTTKVATCDELPGRLRDLCKGHDESGTPFDPKSVELIRRQYTTNQFPDHTIQVPLWPGIWLPPQLHLELARFGHPDFRGLKLKHSRSPGLDEWSGEGWSIRFTATDVTLTGETLLEVMSLTVTSKDPLILLGAAWMNADGKNGPVGAIITWG